MRNNRNQYLALRHPFGFLTRMVLTLFLLCALTTVHGGTPHDPTARSLGTSFYQRSNNNNNNNINNIKIDSNQNDKDKNENENKNNNNNNNNKDENDNNNNNNLWSRPWDASAMMDLGVQPTQKPTKAPNTDKPTNPPTTKRPTWAPVTRWPTATPATPATPYPTLPPTAAPILAAPVTAPPVTALPTNHPTLPPSSPFPTAWPTTRPVTAAPVTAAPVTAAPVTAAPVTATPVAVVSDGTAMYAIERLPTLQPTTVVTSNPTLRPTVAPTGIPTDPATAASTTHTVQNTTTPVPTASTGTPSASPTLLPTTKVQPVKEKDLEDMQVIAVGSELQNVSISFSIWFSDREGANEADHDSVSPGIQTAVRSMLEYLFCDFKKDYLVDTSYWQAMGLTEYYQEHRLCAFSINVVDGDGMIGDTAFSQQSSTFEVDGGRNRYLKEDTVDKNLEAYEKGKWDPNEWNEIDQKFAEWQDRAGGDGDQASESKNKNTIDFSGQNTIDATNQNDQDNKDNNSDEKDDQTANDNEDANDKEDAKANVNAQNEEKNKVKEETINSATATGSDASVLLEPPQLRPHVHFNAHNNLAYTSWNVSWPVVRLSMDYLEKAWKSHTKGGDATSQEIVAYGITLMQGDMMESLKENVKRRVLDVVLEEMLQEPVRVSMVGHEKETFGVDILVQDGDSNGNGMRAVALNPHAIHTLRVVGIALFALTLKFIFILSCLSSRRKKAREAEYQRRQEGKGTLHVNGVEEMLNKTKTVRKDPLFEVPRSRVFQSDPADEWHIPMPTSLKPIPLSKKHAET